MITREIGRLRSRMAVYKRALDSANKIIIQGLDVCPDAFVSCSFGKDSLVMLDMVMKHKPNIEARFIKWEESNLLYNFSDVEDKWKERGANVKVLNLSRGSLDENVSERFDLLAGLNDANGSFVGLRAQESKVRRITLLANGVVFKNKKDFWRICPLAFWQTEDVAAYVYENNLPMLSVYDDAGYQSRTSSRVPRTNFGIREQMLQELKQRDIHSFLKLKKIYPEVTEYV